MRSYPKIRDNALLLTWLLHSAIIMLLTYVNPNHYTTIDSHYYLASASHWLCAINFNIAGRNFYDGDSIFPIGYPAAISAVSLLTSTHVLIASKLVNILASGVWLIYLKRWFGKERASWLFGILFLGSFLKLWAHTWSEPLFLIILFCWTYHFYKIDKYSKNTSAGLFMLGVFLIVTRYAGIFIIASTFAFSVYHYQQGHHLKAKRYAGQSFGWALFFIFYLVLNKLLSGAWYGGDRFDGNISILPTCAAFSKGILNELLIRDISSGGLNLLSFMGLGIQSAAVYLIIQHKRYPLSALTIHFWLVAAGYLVFLFTARLFSPFDEPGYRLLAPFSFIALGGSCLIFEIRKPSKLLQYVLYILIVFSWLDLLPQQDFKAKLCKALNAQPIRFH